MNDEDLKRVEEIEARAKAAGPKWLDEYRGCGCCSDPNDDQRAMADNVVDDVPWLIAKMRELQAKLTEIEDAYNRNHAE